MSKIAEKKVFELGHSKDPFSREEFTANDIFDACVECYDQAMQDFLEKAEEFFKSELYVSVSDQICSMNEFKTKNDFINYFKNYMKNEM
jgi:hypothetical protein